MHWSSASSLWQLLAPSPGSNEIVMPTLERTAVIAEAHVQSVPSYTCQMRLAGFCLLNVHVLYASQLSRQVVTNSLKQSA